jgi:hypothetical protein
MKLRELIDELKDGYDPEPSALHREAERMAALMELAAHELELNELKIQQLAEINDEMTNMVLMLNKRIREYENLMKVKRLRGI